MISRAEGYRRSVGKEHKGLKLATSFLSDVLQLTAVPVHDKERNYSHGDLLIRGKYYIEVKSQPINPVKHPQNFVELFEITANPKHAGGFERIVELLNTSRERLAAVQVKPGSRVVQLSNPPMISVSIESSARASWVVYTNPYSDVKFIYVYERALFHQEITSSLWRTGLIRGAGRSNVDTFAVFISLPPAIWKYSLSTSWQFIGNGNEADVKLALRQSLSLTE